MCCNMVTSADELGTGAPADDSNEEWDSSSKTTLNDVEASLLLQMKSTTKHCRVVTQSVDDVCKLSQMYVTPIQRTNSAAMRVGESWVRISLWMLLFNYI